jgi:hypothetical protein
LEQEADMGIDRVPGARGGGVWDFHVSDTVVSPTIRRSHPAGYKKA